MLASAQKGFMRLPERYPEIISQAQAQQVLNAFSNELTSLAQQLLSLSLASVRGLIAVLVYLVLVPLMVFFFLKDKSKIINWMSQFLPSNRGLADQVWREVNAQIANYVRGKIWEILIIWVISYVVFKFLGLRFTMLISLFVGLSVLVPYIGVTVMFLPVGMIAYFQWGWQSEVLYVLIAYAIIQLLDGNLLAPLLLSEVVNLHPVAIIVAVLFFGGIWGIWGLFFAIPLATLVHSVIKAWYSIQSPDSSTAAAA
jgi:putative permease